MIAVILFAAAAASLFAQPLPYCDASDMEGRTIFAAPDYPARHLRAADDSAQVFGWALREEGSLVSLDLAGVAPWPVGAPAWISDVMQAAQGAESSPLDGANVVEAWTTYNGAHWLRCHLADGRGALVFEGRRGQFNAHSCGWQVDLTRAERVIVLTTDAARLPELVPGIPHEAVALPRPEGWASPEARAKVTYFAVGDRADPLSGYVTHRRGPAFPHPEGWTYQDVTGAHNAVLYEGESEEEATAALAKYQASFSTGAPS